MAQKGQYEGDVVYYIYVPGCGYYKRDKHRANAHANPKYESDRAMTQPYMQYSRARNMAKRISPRAVVEAHAWR